MDIKFHITTTNLGTVLLHLIDKNVKGNKRVYKIVETSRLTALKTIKVHVIITRLKINLEKGN